MKNTFLNDYCLITLAAILLAGCAATSDQASSGPAIKRISPEELARIVPKPVAKLSLDDIVRLSQQGTSPDEIIAQIKAVDSLYDLTPSQSVELSRKGVDARVLDYMHEQRELALQNNIADEINRREKQKQVELAKLKNRMWQQRYYAPRCGYGFSPYGFGGFGSHFGHRFGVGTGIGFPLGCW